MTKTALKELIFKYHPNIVFLSETRLKNDKVSEIRRKCNFPFGITVKPVKTGGGLALWWDHSVVVQVLSKSKNLIDTVIKFKADGSHIRISWFYGPPKKEFKAAFWNSITNLAGSIDLPWLCAGDFNEHLWPYEKEGGKPWDPGKRRFLREFMDINDLIDVPFKGQRFTWSNNWPGDGLIMIRLDRGVVNTQWLERWPSMCVFHSPMIGSDHCPLIFESDPPFEKGPKSFKFEPMWVEDPECHEVIDKAWSVSVNGLYAYQWGEKIKCCSTALSKWSRDKFTHNRRAINKNLEQLQLLQDESSTVSRAKCVSISADIVELWNKEEKYWAQRSRVRWLKTGDSNSRFFSLNNNSEKTEE